MRISHCLLYLFPPCVCSETNDLRLVQPDVVMAEKGYRSTRYQGCGCRCCKALLLGQPLLCARVVVSPWDSAQASGGHLHAFVGIL